MDKYLEDQKVHIEIASKISRLIINNKRHNKTIRYLSQHRYKNVPFRYTATNEPMEIENKWARARHGARCVSILREGRRESTV